ncbi:glycosyltransferase family 4 protein [Pseudonocardia kujensis]|uniref:glycosyltransferase family 4 protein n=1 Tax=Pseudonocardia kujensis TaxID=1128675 RepID=UPI001E36F15A|nr:glycosyltransferase family 4 protein [Pseudonocardia kujensis]MCE0767859.1 glycosyltransferase family 4 protein [Pseudonocardia kujensis]
MADVVQVLDSLDPGGAERHVVDLARALVRRGHHVEVAASAAGPLARELERAGVPLHVVAPVRVTRRACPEFAEGLADLLDRLRPDVVHAHRHAATLAAAQAVGPGTALVVTEHTEALWRTPADRAHARAALRRAEIVVSGSGPIEAALRAQGMLPPGAGRVVGPAVTAGPTSGAAPPAWRGRPVIGRVCRLQPDKGVDVFLRAASLLAPRLPTAVFPVLGDGPAAAELRALGHWLGLDGRVHWLGYRPDARAILPCLDVLAVTSGSDAGQLVVLEAFAAGVPVVGAAVGGIPEQVRSGRNGLLVPPGDAAALARALYAVVTRPVLARRLREGARRGAAAHSFDAMVDALEGAYADALAPLRPASAGA